MTISSFSPPSEESFEGYAFVGADFIAGSDGFSRFREGGGRWVLDPMVATRSSAVPLQDGKRVRTLEACASSSCTALEPRGP